MKNKIALLAGLAAVAFSTPAFADVTIRITGSTAMRSQVHSTLTTGLGFNTDAWTANSASSASSASFHIYSKGTSPDKTTIKTSWSGSVAGIQAVAQNLTTLKWLPDGTTGTALNATTTPQVEAVPADIAFSDVWQNASVFNTPTLSDTIVGVVQFRWVTNEGSPITNITPQQARVLYSSGELPLSFFTGNTTDVATKVYAFGRDPDSGTRVTAFAEPGLGTNPTVVQYKPTVSSGAMTEIYPYPATTLFGIPLVTGNSGESSGSTLASFMGATSASVPVRASTGFTTGQVPAAQIYAIAPLGTSDAATAVTAGAINIAYNGVNPAVGAPLANAIKNGSYHFWSYLHCMHNGLNDTEGKLSFYNTLTSTLITTDAGGIKLSEMAVQRFSDGGNIFLK
jgi:hypothetical protein